MAGGDLSEATLVSERYLLDLEREAFLSLCTERKNIGKNPTHVNQRKTAEKLKPPTPKRGIRECKSKYFNLKSYLPLIEFPFGARGLIMKTAYIVKHTEQP
jgi:hypothetical protein